MNYQRLFLGCTLGASLLMAGFACDKNGPASGDVSAQIAGAPSCSKDSDCMMLSAGCCSCSHGGKNVAILRSSQQEYMQKNHKDCATTMCAAVISNDPSCKKSQAVCRNHECMLE